MPNPVPDDAKTESLRQGHALHPHPDRVQDADFRAHPDFFDARDLVQVKYEMLRRARTQAQPVTDTAQAFGLSRPVYYKAARAFDRDGLPGLLPERPGPRGPHKFTPELAAFLAAERKRDPAARPAELARRVEQVLHIRVHPRSIARHLQAGDKKNTP